jgi:hypothetical protein
VSLLPSASYAQIQAETIEATIATLAAHQRRRELIDRIDGAVETCEVANLNGVTDVPRDVIDLVVDLQARAGEPLFVPRTIAEALADIENLTDLLASLATRDRVRDLVAEVVIGTTNVCAICGHESEEPVVCSVCSAWIVAEKGAR